MRYRIKIIAKVIETYEVEANSPEEAEDKFAYDGKLLATSDNIENGILDVQEIPWMI